MTPILTGIIASGISGHLTPPWSPEGGFDALATVIVPAGDATSVTFSGIPSGYKHLQVRAMHLYTPNADNMIATYNGSIPGTISHFIYGDGTSATASNNNASGGILSLQSGTTSTSFVNSVWDYLDYTNPNKNKVVRGLTGQEVNGLGTITLLSNLVATTSPITSITYSYYNGNSIKQGSQFALYGVK